MTANKSNGVELNSYILSYLNLWPWNHKNHADFPFNAFQFTNFYKSVKQSIKVSSTFKALDLKLLSILITSLMLLWSTKYDDFALQEG